MNKISITFLMLFTIAVYPVQHGVTQVDIDPVKKIEDSTIYRPGPSPGTDALAKINSKTDIAVKKIVQDLIADNKNKDLKLIQSNAEKAALKMQLAEVTQQLAYQKSHPDTTYMVGEPKYQVTKVIMVPDKDGGKNKKRGAKVSYDTAATPVIQWTASRTPLRQTGQ